MPRRARSRRRRAPRTPTTSSPRCRPAIRRCLASADRGCPAVRALNHRYLDLQLRVPQALAPVEADVRALVNKHVARGRVELSISLQVRQTPGVEVEFNEEFGRALETALEQARARGLVSGTLTPGDLLRLPQALTIRDRSIADDEASQTALATQARKAVEQALVDLDSMRTREGD